MTTDEIHAYLRDPKRPNLRFFPYAVAHALSDLAAILLYDIHVRITRQKKPLKRGRWTWTYDAMRVFAEFHTYASEAGIRKAFAALEAAGLIYIEKGGTYNKKGYDRKHWYRLTDEGSKKCQHRRIRFKPDVATTLDIPKAVILEHFRHELHERREEYVSLKPANLDIPYSEKTIGRHLQQLAGGRILEEHPNADYRYRVPPGNAPERDEPITVSPEHLLPALDLGEVGLLVGHSGNGKTSFSTFVAVQCALAGSKVVFATVEEPASAIINRMYAQEYGVSYTDLHNGLKAASDEVERKQNEANERTRTLAQNLVIIDLSGQYPRAQQILDQIAHRQQGGFVPDVVIIDQLEFTSSHAVGEDGIPEETVARAVPLAAPLSACFRNQPFKTWVLHQVNGACAITFPVEAISGGADVAKCFDCVVGIGRSAGDSQTLRVFSLISETPFERFFEADLKHMRFVPKDK